ncbi:MAG: response regulator [Chitinispirillaceae bacterium]
MGMRKKVLWVDDEIEFLRSHIMFLETRGYSVFPVFSGDDAVELIQENSSSYDIVLLDEQMPGKDGLTTLGEIKEIDPDLPVVMVTKSEEERVMEIALGKKIDGYLTKPVNPSQILLVCKRILDSRNIITSQLAQKYLRKYSDNRTLIARPMSTPDWMKLYESLIRWDLEFEQVDNEGLRQMHAGQKSDCNALFCNHVWENYARWVKGEGKPPLMSVDILKNVILPEVNKGKNVFLVVLSGMKLDQFLGIESELRKMFAVAGNRYVATLPTTSEYTRASLLSGQYPQTVAESFPDLFSAGLNETKMAELISWGLELLGMGGIQTSFISHKHASDSTRLFSSLERVDSTPALVTVVVDVIGQFMQKHFSEMLFKEMAPDEVAFRKLTHSWFQHSSILQMLKKLAQSDSTVVLTSDHGHILCSRGTEIYGTRELGENLRCVFGENLSSDERRAVVLNELSHFKIPASDDKIKCLMARENYYFIYPEKFEHYRKQYQNSFQCGGISMEEMIMPLSVCRPMER